MNAILSANNFIPGRKPPGPTSKTFQIAQAVELQANMRQRALDPETKPVQAAACARVCKEIALVLLALRGVGVPAPIKVEPKRAARSVAVLSRVRADVIQPIAEPPGADPAS